MPSSVPDVIYALASIAGDEGCSRWCAQEVYVNEQSYSTAEAANAAAEEELLGPPVPEVGFDGNPIKDEPRSSVILNMIVGAKTRLGTFWSTGPRFVTS